LNWPTKIGETGYFCEARMWEYKYSGQKYQDVKGTGNTVEYKCTDEKVVSCLKGSDTTCTSTNDPTACCYFMQLKGAPSVTMTAELKKA